MPRTYFLVPGYGAQGGTAADLAHCFNEDGLGAVVNSSRGIIAASYRQEKYKQFGPEHFAEALPPGCDRHGWISTACCKEWREMAKVKVTAKITAQEQRR